MVAKILVLIKMPEGKVFKIVDILFEEKSIEESGLDEHFSSELNRLLSFDATSNKIEIFKVLHVYDEKKSNRNVSNIKMGEYGPAKNTVSSKKDSLFWLSLDEESKLFLKNDSIDIITKHLQSKGLTDEYVANIVTYEARRYSEGLDLRPNVENLRELFYKEFVDVFGTENIEEIWGIVKYTFNNKDALYTFCKEMYNFEKNGVGFKEQTIFHTIKYIFGHSSFVTDFVHDFFTSLNFTSHGVSPNKVNLSNS